MNRIPEPLRSEVLATQEIRQDVVLGYWDELMRSEPERLQARVEQVAAAIDVRGAQLEEWPGRGHFVPLAEADRFAGRLRAFVDFCKTPRRV